jgi:hypothetical protein
MNMFQSVIDTNDVSVLDGETAIDFHHILVDPHANHIVIPATNALDIRFESGHGNPQK